MSKPNVREIAANANVSPATVCNALNGRGGVSKAVAEQIHAIQGHWATRPSAERALRRHVRLVVFKTHGLVIMDTVFFAEMIECMQKECERAGWSWSLLM